MDQARPQQAKRRRKGDRGFKIGRPAPHLTPSGGGHTPTPDRSKTPAIGSALRRVDNQRPVTEVRLLPEPPHRRSRPVMYARCPAKPVPIPSLTLPSACGTASGATTTEATLSARMPRRPATLGLTVRMRPPASDLRSRTLTIATRPFRRLVTRAVVPRGRLLLATKEESRSKRPPSAILLPASSRA